MVENQENHEVNVLNVGDELNVSVLKLEEKQVVVDTGTKYDGVSLFLTFTFTCHTYKRSDYLKGKK